GSGGETFVKGERPADANVPLDVGNATEFIERSFHTVDDDAVRAVGIGDGERTSGFGLPEQRYFKSLGELEHTREDEAIGDVFARGPVIALPEGIERIADAVYVVKQLA